MCTPGLSHFLHSYTIQNLMLRDECHLLLCSSVSPQPGDHRIGNVDWPASPKHPPVSVSLVPGLHALDTSLGFFFNVELSPHAYKTLMLTRQELLDD